MNKLQISLPSRLLHLRMHPFFSLRFPLLFIHRHFKVWRRSNLRSIHIKIPLFYTELYECLLYKKKSSHNARLLYGRRTVPHRRDLKDLENDYRRHLIGGYGGHTRSSSSRLPFFSSIPRKQTSDTWHEKENRLVHLFSHETKHAEACQQVAHTILL